MQGPRHHTKKRGDFAVGECGRSGQKMLLKNMVWDGYYPGLQVHPRWYEGRQPQEDFKAVYDDPSLRDPMPQNNMENQTIRWPLLDLDTFETIPAGAVSTFGVGKVSFPFVSGVQSNFSAGNAIGAVSPEDIDSESTFAAGDVIVALAVIPTGQQAAFSAGDVTILLDSSFWGSDTWSNGAWGQ